MAEDFAELLSSLRAPLYENRLDAIQQLVETGASGVDRLIQVLTAPADEADRHDYIRGHVAEILGDIGDNRAFEVLVECTESDSEFLRQKSIAALGKLGDVRSIGLLIAHLRNHWDAETREEAAWALANFPELWVIRTLIRALSDPAQIVRDAAYAALIQLEPPAKGELLKAAETDDLSARQQLLAVLESMNREP
jgi:bilin biosynthesis protein